MKPVTVAAAQIACLPGDLSANLALHHGTLVEARRIGVDLLVFPELSLTGYESDPDTGRLARGAGSPDLLGLAEAGRGLVVVVGFIEVNPDGRPFNTCAVLAGGRVVHLHRKVNLPTYGRLVEGQRYAAGSTLDLFASGLGRTACLICADTWNPALPWLAALGGADAMVVPVASARGAVDDDFDPRDGWTLNLRHTALTYGVPVVMANHCCQQGDLGFWGGSMVIDAFGRVVAQAGEDPSLLVATLAPQDGRAARARLPTMRDAAPGTVRTMLDARLHSAPEGEFALERVASPLHPAPSPGLGWRSLTNERTRDG